MIDRGIPVVECQVDPDRQRRLEPRSVGISSDLLEPRGARIDVIGLDAVGHRRKGGGLIVGERLGI